MAPMNSEYWVIVSNVNARAQLSLWRHSRACNSILDFWRVKTGNIRIIFAHFDRIGGPVAIVLASLSVTDRLTRKVAFQKFSWKFDSEVRDQSWSFSVIEVGCWWNDTPFGILFKRIERWSFTSLFACDSGHVTVNMEFLDKVNFAHFWVLASQYLFPFVCDVYTAAKRCEYKLHLALTDAPTQWGSERHYDLPNTPEIGP
jgi:hypothetical protein